jgi:hypothetical protein
MVAHGGVFDAHTFAFAAVCTFAVLFLVRRVGFFRLVGISIVGAVALAFFHH